MATFQLCRVCLRRDTGMQSVTQTSLLKFYEKVTNKTFHIGHGKASVVCYICHHLLKKCHRFVETAIKADEMVQHIYNNGMQETDENTSELQRSFKFAISPLNIVNVAGLIATNEDDPKETNENTSELQKSFKTFAISPLNIVNVMGVIATNEDDPKVKIEFNEDLYDERLTPVAAVDVKMEVTSEDKTDCLSENIGRTGKAENIVRVDDPTYSLEYEYFEVKEETGVRGAGEGLCSKAAQHSRGNTPDASNVSCLDGTGTNAVATRIDYGNHLPLNLKDITTKSEQLNTHQLINKQSTASNNELLIELKEKLKRKIINKKSVTITEVTVRKVKDSVEKLFKCDECGIKFTRKHSLAVHRRIHIGDKPFSCDQCGVKFSRKYNLAGHISRKHDGDKPFVCNECGIKFARKGELTAHFRMHTGDKPFSCDYCEKKFTQKKYLTKHIIGHKSDKSFACDECGIKFTHKYSLAYHLRTHSGQKLFPCRECGKSFARKGILTAHARGHMNDKRYACAQCGNRYKHTYNLQTHLLGGCKSAY